MNDSVSILIPTRNRSAILARCLAALPEGVRGFDPPEIIVADDCSTDNTPETVDAFRLLHRWPVRYLHQDKPLGANAARNAALHLAQGEIIVLIDDDSIVSPGWLAALVRGLSEETPVVTGTIHLNVEGAILGRHRSEVSTYLCEVLAAPRGEYGETVPVACNMAAYRKVFDRAQFDESVRPPCEEGDWLRRAGVTAGFVPEAVVVHYKMQVEAGLEHMLRLAWLRGSEGGWWVRERSQAPRSKCRALAMASLKTAARSFGHAASQLCWGGVVVGCGEFSRALALAGIINRGSRSPESWR